MNDESHMERGASVMRMAWLVVGLLWPVALLNYLDRQMLAAMKFSVMADIVRMVVAVLRPSELNSASAPKSERMFTP